jgi:hypothetical protein
VLVVAVLAIVRNADLDPKSEDVVSAALELVGNVEVVVSNALLVDIPVRECLRTANVRAVATTPALLNAVLAVNEDSRLDDVEVSVPDVDLDDNLGVGVLLVELNNERAEGVVVQLKGTSDSDLKVVLDVGVVVTLAVTALLVARVAAQLLEVVGVRALTEDDNLSALAGNINLMSFVLVGARLLVILRHHNLASLISLGRSAPLNRGLGTESLTTSGRNNRLLEILSSSRDLCTSTRSSGFLLSRNGSGALHLRNLGSRLLDSIDALLDILDGLATGVVGRALWGTMGRAVRGSMRRAMRGAVWRTVGMVVLVARWL